MRSRAAIRLSAVVTSTALMGASTPGAAAATGSSPPECPQIDADGFRDLESQRLRALVDADLDVFAGMLADDFELVDPVGDLWTRDS